MDYRKTDPHINQFDEFFLPCLGNSTTMDDSNKSRRQNKISFKCEICEKEFKSKNSVRYHFTSAHMMVREHKFYICQSVFNLQSKLTSHVKNSHVNKMKHHKCDACMKTFSHAEFSDI